MGKWGAPHPIDVNGEPITNDVHPRLVGSAGDVANKDQIPTTGSATYKGDAIGTVASNGKQYVATGDMNMNWSFQKRLGILAISNFDNKSFSGNMAAPGKVQFSGIVAGSNVIGTATGAFVGPSCCRVIAKTWKSVRRHRQFRIRAKSTGRRPAFLAARSSLKPPCARPINPPHMRPKS